MSNAIICINKKVCVQEFWYILSGLDKLIFNLSNPKMKILHV